jgi:hypothetical protein
MAQGVESKVRMVKARLLESQTQALKRRAAHLMVSVRSGAGDRLGFLANPDGNVVIVALQLHADRGTRSTLWAYGRTGHLTAPYLLCCVSTGLPKRAALHGPAWRRSSHRSRIPGVMPGTAAGSRTAMAETDRATGRGTPASRVKGNASAGISSSRPAQEGAPMHPDAGQERPNPLRSEGKCRSRMMGSHQVRFRERGRGDA